MWRGDGSGRFPGSVDNTAVQLESIGVEWAGLREASSLTLSALRVGAATAAAMFIRTVSGVDRASARPIEQASAIPTTVANTRAIFASSLSLCAATLSRGRQEE